MTLNKLATHQDIRKLVDGMISHQIAELKVTATRLYQLGVPFEDQAEVLEELDAEMFRSENATEPVSDPNPSTE